MVIFNFYDVPSLASAVSPSFWTYWMIAIPVTLIIVAYAMWETSQARMQYQQEKVQEETYGNPKHFLSPTCQVVSGVRNSGIVYHAVLYLETC